jgi:hypothetical protein
MYPETNERKSKNSAICLKLGRIYLQSGKKNLAIKIFHLGLQDDKNSQIAEELNALGIRKPPVIPILNRNNSINKYIGKFLHRLGLR